MLLTELFTLSLHSWETFAGFPSLGCFLALRYVKNPASLQGKLDFYHTHLAAKSPKVTFKYSCKAASLSKVKSSIEVSKKGDVDRRQEKKENIDNLSLFKNCLLFAKFVFRKVDKREFCNK